MLRQMAAEAGLPVEVSSRGYRAEIGRPMWPPVAAHAASRGYDGSTHIARQLSHEAIDGADLVVVLSAVAQAHREVEATCAEILALCSARTS